LNQGKEELILEREAKIRVVKEILGEINNCECDIFEGLTKKFHIKEEVIYKGIEGVLKDKDT